MLKVLQSCRRLLLTIVGGLYLIDTYSVDFVVSVNKTEEDSEVILSF